MSDVGFFFYTGDWIKATRVLSIGARGAWFDALCFLNENRGAVVWPISSYASYWSVSIETAVNLLEEIRTTNVGDVEWQTIANDNKGIAKLSCRRMVRWFENQEQISRDRSEAGKKGAEKRWKSNGKNGTLLNPSLNLSGSSYKNKMTETVTLEQPKEEKKPEPKRPKELDPGIKVWADKIYRIDRDRYSRLIVWIKAAERSYQTEVIASALERYFPYARNVSDWWSYLDRILDKQEGIYNARKEETQNDYFKSGPLPDFIKSVK